MFEYQVVNSDFKFKMLIDDETIFDISIVYRRIKIYMKKVTRKVPMESALCCGSEQWVINKGLEKSLMAIKTDY